jgi:hypothetical protein
VAARRTAALALLAAVAGVGGLHASTAAADPVTSGMPTQAWTDLSSSDPRTGGQPGWGDLPGGTGSRPYVTAMTVTNGTTVTPVVTDGTTTPEPTPAGGVTTVVSPFNLCRAGQTPGQGMCYAMPNRVGLTVAYNAGEVNGFDFAHAPAAGAPVTPSITPDSVIDMTVALNTLGKSLRWTWVNGDLLSWQTSNLGQDNATVRIRFRPATAPWVSRFPDGNGCTATPIFDCSLPTADAEQLTANLVFSLDNTLDPALTGAVFATRNAISGYLQPGGTAQAPSLDLQVASTHTKADGSPQLGTLQAFLPAATLVNLYGVLPADAGAFFSTTRTGDAGTNDAPSYTPWTTAANGADGLLVTVRNITFSVPDYRVAARLKPAAAKAQAKRGRTTIAATLPACTAKARCLATVYDTGRAGASRYASARKVVLANKVVTTRAMSLTVPTPRLRAGERYLLVVHAAKGNKLIASTVGVVR